MQQPAQKNMKVLKRLMRYLSGTKQYGLTFPRQKSETMEIEVYVDSDWASRETCRKSTSGGILKVNGCTVASWSRGQSVVSLSSGEADFYAVKVGVVEGLGIQV